jgi:hypothetical protein
VRCSSSARRRARSAFISAASPASSSSVRGHADHLETLCRQRSVAPAVFVEGPRGAVHGPTVDLDDHTCVGPDQIHLLARYREVGAGLRQAVVGAEPNEVALTVAACEGGAREIESQGTAEPTSPAAVGQLLESAFERRQIEQPEQLSLVYRPLQSGERRHLRQIHQRSAHTRDGDGVYGRPILGVDDPRPMHGYTRRSFAPARSRHLDPRTPCPPNPPQIRRRAVAEQRVRSAGKYGRKLA